MGAILDSRRVYTKSRIGELQGRLHGAQQICGADACAYMTGSFARGEATEHSDLDLLSW